MIFWYMIYFIILVFESFVFGIHVFGPQPKIVAQDGHLILYAAEHKNITLQTHGKGGIHVNGIDLAQAAKISNDAAAEMKRYKSNFESSSEKISKFEQLLDGDNGLIQKVMTLEITCGKNSTDVPVNVASVVRSVRRFNRRVNALQRQIRSLTQLLTNDECVSNPCKNGGTCQDVFNGFICHCPPEWEGSFCDKDINECARFVGTDLGCQNGATCINRQGSYECLCPNGWLGLHCTRRTADCNSGSNSELCGYGTCVTQYNDPKGYKCICDQGWTTDGKSSACNTDVDECSSNKHPCSVNPWVQCINYPGSFHCSNCPTGYSGNGYYCTDIDECSDGNNGGCSVNPMVQCVNTLGSRRCGNCPPGYAGDGIRCSYQGVCNVDNGGCHRLATCRNNPRIGSTFVECVCPLGYIGNGIGPNGCIRSLQPTGSCSPNPCLYGTCRLNGSDYTCQCYRRYTGRNCDSLKNLCTSNPCLNGGTCVSYIGMSYRCTCPSGYTGIRCQTERQACGGRLQTDTGVLVFPSGQFQNYGNRISCAWTIETNTSLVLNITFKRFNVEHSDSCQYDWLQIHDGKNTLARSLGRFCGHDLPNGGTIISTHNIVYMWFRSDQSVVGEGFELNWSSVAPFCGAPLKSVTSHGIIHSPGSPGNYPNNRDCYWPIVAPLGKRLLFQFFTLMIGNNSDCNHDYLEFISGTVSTDPVFAKFCNTSHPSPIFSSGSEVLIHFHSDNKTNYPGFQITYSVAEGIPGCGGVYTRHQGEIRSPTYNGNYPDDALCEYKIQLSAKSRIKLTFLSFALEDSTNCQFDYVAIHAGSTSDAPLINKYCGSNLPPSYITEDNVVLIVFKTDWSTSDTGFVIKYDTVCGGRYTASTGVLESPGYPDGYEQSLECLYEIIQPLSTIIKLQILDLDLEENSYPDCIYDYLEIRDGANENSTLIGTYCKKPPPLIVSNYNFLWLKFYTDTSNSGKGFQANYTTAKLGCGGILKDKTGTISTPNYPDVYPPGTLCKWIISAPPGNIIQIVWLNFQLEKSYDCSYDYVEIFDNNTETGKGMSIGKYCGQVNPPMIHSMSTLVTITFFSDETYHMGGFMATYTFTADSNLCGGNYYTEAGLLKSPDYPNDYPDNVECIWTIHARHGQQIMLNITDFELESSSGCRYDSLEIRNGANAISPLLGKYCGTNIPKLLPSHTNKLYIYFTTDMTNSARGFKITWDATTTGCGGTLSSPTGSITSPNYPEPYAENTECLWKISVSAGSIIQAVFSDLDLEEHTECVMDYVELLDGPGLNSKSLGKFCTVNPSFIRSTSNSITVKFESDISRNGRGFQLQYVTMCNNTVTGFRGIIESPNFPNNYPNSANCNWEIKVADRNKINITFSHFDLEKLMTDVTLGNISDSTCSYDYVEILYMKFSEPFEEEEEGTFEKYGTYCSDNMPQLITLNSDHAKIRFVSDNLVEGNGFRLEWQIEGCGDILTHPNGTILSPNYPKAYPPSIECNWLIQVEYGSHVEITIPKLELEETHICNLDYIKLFNGEDDSYPEIATICYQKKPVTLRSSGNFMFVKFKADASIQGLGFKANYTSSKTKCGGKFVADKANIMSPNYPNNYDKNDTCGYLIEVGEGHMIELKFEDFDLYTNGENNCTNNQSHVKVYDGPSIDYPVLAKICGKDAPNETLVSTTNTMYVEMVTNNDMVSKGFLAKYQKSCGARIETEGTGFIRIGANDIDYDEMNCSWTIVSKDLRKHVNLIVTHLDTFTSFCDVDEKPLRIFNGESPTAPLLGEYCGSKLPPPLTSDGAAMHIVIEYNSVLFATYSVFENACGGTLTSTEGFFASPGYPKRYPLETECEWIIHAEQGNHISLSFTYFELLESDHCNTDYLEIRQNNGTGKLLGTFCGDNMPDNITHSGSLWLLLKTSRMEGDVSSITAKGFYAEYFLNRENELFGSSGTIVSPLYSKPFPFYGDFSWKITVDYGKRILLTIKEIFLEGGVEMCFSEIDIYDGPDSNAPSLGELCGSQPPDAIKTTSNVVFIKFSGYSTTRSSNRFVLEWLQVDSTTKTSQPKGCGSKDSININVLKNYTIINSPGYPNGYENNLECEWIITTIPMNHLTIYISDLQLQKNYGTFCYADYVEIFQKKINADWESVLKTCYENYTALPLIHTTNLMKIVFKTDRYENGTGFSSRVKEACGGTLTDPSGYIIYDNNTRVGYGLHYADDCQWNITLRAGKTIQIEVLKFDIFHKQDKGCNYFLLVRNGKFPDSPLLGEGKYCGVREPFTLNTTGNNAYIKFVGLSATSDFTIRYREVSYECGGEIRLTHFVNSTVINSPNYPNIAPPHVECFWRIIAPPGEVLRIDFIDRFDLKEVKDCRKEYVELRDGGTQYSKLIAKFCSVPNSQFTTDNMLYVKFFTDMNEPSNGFKAKISLEKCGGTIRGRTGRVQSPFFGQSKKYPVNMNCTWHLLAQENHFLKIKFEKIDLEDENNCTSVDHVTIYEENAETNKANIFGSYCGKTIPSDIETSSNEAIIHFQTGKESKELKGFSLLFNSSLQECGGTIEASEGTITSPGYPLPHKTHRRCKWSITVPFGRRVTLEIEDMDMNTRTRKSYLNGLSIYNNKDYKGNIYRSLFSSSPKTVRSSENTMMIIYWAEPNSGRGFKAKYSSNEPTVCEGDLNQASGTITQPKEQLPSYRCTYTRNRPLESKTVAMSITTTNNSTLKELIGCNYVNGGVLVKSGDEKISVASVCTPNTVFVRVPLPNIKIIAYQTSFKGQVNFTINYNTYACGGVINDEMGTITSPAYPNKYSSSIECSWVLNIPKEQSIELTFNGFDLGDDCVKSYLDIYNGGSPSSPKIGRFCQNQVPGPIKSETNKLWIDYKFDVDSNGKGFSVKYEPLIHGCGGVFHDHTRIIQTPSYPKDYPNNAECSWELRSDEGHHIGFTFISRFQIEQSDNCENDFVEIWDWKNNDWLSLGKKCGRDIPKSINSTSNKLKILFRSNDRIGGQGFRAKWEWNCGGSFYPDNTERFIVSPGFPLRYKKNMNCQYNITAKQGEYVNIKFFHFNLEGTGSNCKYDNLSISNIWDRGGNMRYIPLQRQVFCGAKSPPYVRLANTVYIKFMSDGYVERTGFKFSYQLDDCGGKINSPTVISTPSMNATRTLGLYTGYLSCLWNITAPPKKNVIVRFQKFSFSFRQHCYFDNVEIYDAPQSNREKMIANLCGNLNNDPPVIRSTNNSLLIRLRTDRSMNHDGFKAEIYFSDGPQSGCGGRIDLNKSTTIIAPNLLDMDCTWNIYSTYGTTVKLQITELSLPSTCGSKNHTLTNCTCSSLEIRDGNSPASDVMEKFCGITSNNFARELVSSGNSAMIRLYTRGSINNAFKVIVVPIPSMCGPYTMNVTNSIQTFTSPGYPNGYPNNLRCTWIFKGSTKFVIHFVDFELDEGNKQNVNKNVCKGDKVQIVDEINGSLMNYRFNYVDNVISGNRRLTTDFSRYSLISGTYDFCGNSDKPFDYYTQVGYLTLKFSSRNVGNSRGKGFKFEYHTVGCNRNYTSINNRIVNHVVTNCYQTITVPDNYTISLFFQQFVLYQSPSCEKVGMEIRDGNDKSANLIQKSCGYALPSAVFSTKNQLWIHVWNTLGTRLPSNYDLVYTSSDQGRGCGGVFYNYKGTFTSPLHPQGYTSSTPCVWDVRVPIGMRVAITFSIFDIQGDCVTNYLKVTTYDKEDSNDHTFCKEDVPAVLYSSAHLLVTYQSSTLNKGTGWSAQFEAVDQ